MIKQYFLPISGSQLEVLESEGKGCPIVCFHGNSSSASSFSPLLSSDLAKKHRIIAVSFPGHGKSSVAIQQKAIYNVPALGGIAAEFVSHFQFDAYFLLGQSVGGHALLQALHQFDNLKGIFLASSPPVNLSLFQQAFKSDPSDGLLFKGKLNQSECEKLASCFTHHATAAMKKTIMFDIARTDQQFRSSLGQSLKDAVFNDEIAAIAALKAPAAVIGGNEDMFLNPEYFSNFRSKTLWRNEAILLKNKGHALQIEASHELNKLISAFINDVQGATHE